MSKLMYEAGLGVQMRQNMRFCYLLHMQKSPINSQADVRSRARGPNETENEILLLIAYAKLFNKCPS